jgi:hypothetical protein
MEQLCDSADAGTSVLEALPALQDAAFLEYLKAEQESEGELREVVVELLANRTQVRTLWGCIHEAAALLDVLQVFPKSTIYEVRCACTTMCIRRAITVLTVALAASVPCIA